MTMKKKFRFMTAIALALSIAISMLAACTKKDDDSTQSAAKSTAVTTAAKTTAKATTAGASKTAAATGSAASAAVQTQAAVTEGEAVETGTGETIEEEYAEVGTSIGSGEVVEEKSYDLKGRVIKVKVHAATLVPQEAPGNVGGPTTWYLMKEAEQKFNCTFEYEVITTMALYLTQVTNSALAGVYYCDMFRGTRPSSARYWKNRMF